MLISNFAICLDKIIKHYGWELNQVAFSAEEQARSSDWLDILGNKKVGKSTLTSILQFIAVEHRSSRW
jgi:ABC-type arginine transport system ATPase subunit